MPDYIIISQSDSYVVYNIKNIIITIMIMIMLIISTFMRN